MFLSPDKIQKLLMLCFKLVKLKDMEDEYGTVRIFQTNSKNLKDYIHKVRSYKFLQRSKITFVTIAASLLTLLNQIPNHLHVHLYSLNEIRQLLVSCGNVLKDDFILGIPHHMMPNHGLFILPYIPLLLTRNIGL